MYNNYLNCIENNLKLPPNKWNFKSDKMYRAILEHVSKPQGELYLNYLTQKCDLNFEDFRKKIYENDRLGAPIKSWFSKINIDCSPTNCRYLLHSVLILKYIQTLDLKSVDIIEIGGGYGGLCFYLFKICSYFDIEIASYSIFDLKPVSKLQERYLSEILGGDIEKVSFNQLELDRFELKSKESFLVSNYAFSEISEKLQDDYIRKVFNPYVKYGFLAWNFINTYNPNEEKYRMDTEPEYPETGNDNKYVYLTPKF